MYLHLFNICDYLYQYGYYSYLIKVGFGDVRMLEVALLWRLAI